MNATLSWNVSSESDLAKYTIYASRADGVWTGASLITSQDITAPTTTVTLSGLPDGVTVYFALTASDNGANESSKSSTVNKINKYIRM